MTSLLGAARITSSSLQMVRVSRVSSREVVNQRRGPEDVETKGKTKLTDVAANRRCEDFCASRGACLDSILRAKRSRETTQGFLASSSSIEPRKRVRRKSKEVLTVRQPGPTRFKASDSCEASRAVPEKGIQVSTRPKFRESEATAIEDVTVLRRWRRRKLCT